MRLNGKIAVITGAGSGIGRAMATRFVAEGASIVAGDWNSDRLQELVETIKASGGTVVGAQGNIADQQTAEGLIERAISTYGRLDILCNNAVNAGIKVGQRRRLSRDKNRPRRPASAAVSDGCDDKHPPSSGLSIWIENVEGRRRRRSNPVWAMW